MSMTESDLNNRARFSMHLDACTNYTNGFQDTFANTDRLHRLNMRLHTLSERSCNGDGWGRSGQTIPCKWDDADEARFIKSWDNAMAKVRAIFAQYGDFTVQEQGDPRGWGMFEATHKESGRVFRINW